MRKVYMHSMYGYVMEQMVRISRMEYEGMKETIEILQDPDVMNQIIESEKNIKSGKVEEFEY